MRQQERREKRIWKERGEKKWIKKRMTQKKGEEKR